MADCRLVSINLRRVITTEFCSTVSLGPNLKGLAAGSERTAFPPAFEKTRPSGCPAVERWTAGLGSPDALP